MKGKEEEVNSRLYTMNQADHLQNIQMILTRRRQNDTIPNIPLMKRPDLGGFSILVLFENIGNYSMLCDLGANCNVMSLSIFKRLGLGKLQLTCCNLQFVNGTLEGALGITRDVVIRVEMFRFLVDFMVMDMGENSNIQVIMGRHFLASSGALIDVLHRTITLRVKRETVDYMCITNHQPQPTNSESRKIRKSASPVHYRSSEVFPTNSEPSL